MNRGAWWATVHGVAKSQTQLSGKKNIYIYFSLFWGGRVKFAQYSAYPIRNGLLTEAGVGNENIEIS